VNDHRIVAIALTPGERALVLRAVREYAKQHDSPPMAADVVAMFENAIDERGMAEFSLACEEVAR
jgi:hypothetical protein